MRLAFVILCLAWLMVCLLTGAVQQNVKNAPLAVLMRNIHTESVSARAKIMSGHKIGKFPKKFEKITTATPTDSAVKTKLFDAIAGEYIVASQKFYGNANKQHFNFLVSSCIKCHEKYCPGPLTRIRTLQIPE